MRGIRFAALLRSISSSAVILIRPVNADAAADRRLATISARALATGNVSTPDVNGCF